MSAKHPDEKITALPWRVGPYYRHEIVSDAGSITCASIETERTRANAAYIVRACNAFPELVKALRMLYEDAKEFHDEPDDEETRSGSHTNCGWCEARRVLKGLEATDASK